MTHTEIVKMAAKWLKRHKQNLVVPNCALVITEMVCANNSGEVADVIGFSSSSSVLIEVKVSRSDFYKDKNKLFRRCPFLGMGNLRYYCCPPNLLFLKDLPSGWGLLYCQDRKPYIEVVAKSQQHEASLANERAVLLSHIRRIKK